MRLLASKQKKCKKEVEMAKKRYVQQKKQEGNTTPKQHGWPAGFNLKYMKNHVYPYYADVPVRTGKEMEILTEGHSYMGDPDKTALVFGGAQV